MAAEKNKQHMSEKPCFLIVDDDHQTVTSVSSMLEPFSSRVDAANCGSAALNCLSETRYDVVITDSEMQDSSGHELARQLKDKFPKIRTIVMRAQNCSETDHNITCTIADACITKPFSMNSLEAVLK